MAIYICLGVGGRLKESSVSEDNKSPKKQSQMKKHYIHHPHAQYFIESNVQTFHPRMPGTSLPSAYACDLRNEDPRTTPLSFSGALAVGLDFAIGCCFMTGNADGIVSVSCIRG